MPDVVTLSEAFSGAQLAILIAAVVYYLREQSRQNARIRDLETQVAQLQAQADTHHTDFREFKAGVYTRLASIEQTLVRLATLLEKRPA